MSLCSSTEVKAALGGATGIGKDTLIASCVSGADQWARTYAGRDFESTSYTEYFSPGFNDTRVIRDGAALLPRHFPIISVTSLYEDDARLFTDPADEILSADYWVGDYTLNLYADGGTPVLSPGERTVRLIYTAGYAIVPSDVNRAAVMLAVHLFHNADKQRQGLASETVNGVTVSYRDEDMPKEAKMILDSYRRPCGL